MQENLIIPLLLIGAGVLALLVGLAKRSRARDMETVPCRHISELLPGERQFITGKAQSPVLSDSPVSKKPCVFYREQIDQYRRQGGRGGGHWERVSETYYGAFFIADPTGQALVLPRAGSLDLLRGELTLDDISDTRKSERALFPDEIVTALGTPRPLRELVGYLRGVYAAGVPPGLVAELIKMEQDPANAGLPCFFGDGLERVADQPYSDYTSGSASSAWLPLAGGAALLLGGLGALLYALGVPGGGVNIE